MFNDALKNQAYLERRLRNKAARGEKINVLIPESSPNTSKVSLIFEIASLTENFQVFVLTHSALPSTAEMYRLLNAEMIVGGSLEDAIFEHSIDILFIENPHHYFDFSNPAHDFYKKLSSSIFTNVLICYVPYAYISISNSDVYTDFFHRLSWRFYLESFFHLLESEKYDDLFERIPNKIVTGHPYLDPYFTDKYDFHKRALLKYESNRKIVWCPHHNPSFYGGVSLADQESVLRSFVEKNEDVVIFFRPHPNLFGALNSKVHIESNDYQILLDQSLLERLSGFWFDHPRIIHVDNAPIYEHFKAADIIVHNCGSYQMEALASGARIINLVHPNILNLHVLQYRDFQTFCSDAGEFEVTLQASADAILRPRIRRIGMDHQVPAGLLIAKDLQRSLT
jgi:hypothetical protein